MNERAKIISRWAALVVVVALSPIWLPVLLFIGGCAPRRTRERWDREANRMSGWKE